MEPSGAAYHVFINHRGADVKRTLASLIYHRLTCHALRVFFDKEEIHTADVVPSAIEDAIQSASVNITIFSQNYAKSSWCLNELLLILRSYRDGRSTIIPVFCDVEPADVRYIKNWYAFAFEEHRQKGRVSEEIMEEWKMALKEISSLLALDAVGSGSLILITSRDKDLLRRSSVKTLIYDVKPLHAKYARELFCRHAFGQTEPNEGFEDLVEGFLKICGGLPLSLKVLGGQFVGLSDKEYWKRQVEKISTTLLPDDIINRLKVSYETLKDEEKQIFLDIGCFFVGEDTELAVRVFEGLGYNNARDCLQSLHQKCLVNFQELFIEESKEMGDLYCIPNMIPSVYFCRDSPYIYWRPTMSIKVGYKLTMHDQIRELARHIARQEFCAFPIFKPLRLCCSDDAQQMLLFQYRSDSFEIRGIRTPQNENDAREITNYIGDVRAYGLKLLAAESSSTFNLSGFSGDLVWLRLHSFDPISFPSTISLRFLRVLELRGLGDRLEQLLRKFDDPPEQLIELNIDGQNMPKIRVRTSNRYQQFDLDEYSKKFSDKYVSNDQKVAPPPSYLYRFLEWIGTRMIKLEKLALRNFYPIPSLPFNFAELKKLTYLDLSGCTKLTQLPESLSQLLQLQYLILRHCSRLSIPLDILGKISTLVEYIDFKGCAKLVHLPVAVASQRSLRYLNIIETSVVSMKIELPDNLEHLRIGSPCLKEVSLSVNGWTKLKEFILFGCSNIKCIDAPIEKFRHLEKLLIYESAVHIVPEGVAALEYIKVLVIEGCPITKFSFQHNRSVMDVQVSRMGCLRDLTLKRTSISELFIPQSDYPSLETLDLSENIQLMRVEGLPSTLVSLNLEGCSTLKTLMIHSNLVHLTFLNINQCRELETLDVEGLGSLEEIRADQCWKLQRIEALIQQERLNRFYISTDHAVIWNDICNFLTSPSQLATVAFSRKADGDLINDEKGATWISDFEDVIATWISEFEHVIVQDGPQGNAVASAVELKNVHSHGGILMCFITCNPTQSFSIQFYGSGDNSSFNVSQTGENRRLHVFMWAEDSKLFENGYTHARVKCSGDDDSVNEAHVKKGWIFMVKRKTDVFKLCKQILSTVK